MNQTQNNQALTNKELVFQLLECERSFNFIVIRTAAVPGKQTDASANLQ
jgi:hypothetical protein